jgi:hypothetical protein
VYAIPMSHEYFHFMPGISSRNEIFDIVDAFDTVGAAVAGKELAEMFGFVLPFDELSLSGDRNFKFRNRLFGTWRIVCLLR